MEQIPEIEIHQFIRASRQCSKCEVRYPSAREASDCVTRKHNLIRCYYCFKVMRSTERLFQHYRSQSHKHAELTHNSLKLMCKFCGVIMPFKSVSTHVISNHLFQKSLMKKREGALGTLTSSVAIQQQSSVTQDEVAGAAVAGPSLPHAAVGGGGGVKALLKKFMTDSKICSFCHTKYMNPAQASLCITNHNLLRCYQCLNHFQNTEVLFEHFRTAHEQGARPRSLECRFCSKSIAYASVSCHTISNHMQRVQQQGGRQRSLQVGSPGHRSEDKNSSGSSAVASRTRAKLRAQSGVGEGQ